MAVEHAEGSSDLTMASDGPTVLKAEGSHIDLLLQFQEIFDFSYSLEVPKDREWGSEGPDGNWSGLCWATLYPLYCVLNRFNRTGKVIIFPGLEVRTKSHGTSQPNV